MYKAAGTAVILVAILGWLTPAAQAQHGFNPGRDSFDRPVRPGQQGEGNKDQNDPYRFHLYPVPAYTHVPGNGSMPRFTYQPPDTPKFSLGAEKPALRPFGRRSGFGGSGILAAVGGLAALCGGLFGKKK
jgi:hypothetical protein